MTTWKTLYLKELRDHRGIFAFLLLISLGLGGYALTVALRSPESVRPEMVLATLPYVLVLVFPFVLTHSFAQEFRGQTHYLLLSLPVPRWHLVLGKFAAVLTGSAALFLVTTLLGHIVFLRLISLAARLGVASRGTGLRVTGTELWGFIAIAYFSTTVLLLGMGTLIAGVKLVVRRFQGILSALCFVGCLYAYGKLFKPAAGGLDFLGGHGGAGIQHLQPQLYILVYSCAMGVLFLALGAWLIEKRVEA